MEMLNVLVQKIESLIAFTKELQSRNKELEAKIEDLNAGKASYEEENLRLLTELESLSGSTQKEQDEIQSLHQEKERTRAAVDDLLNKLKAIDVLAECEQNS